MKITIYGCTLWSTAPYLKSLQLKKYRFKRQTWNKPQKPYPENNQLRFKWLKTGAVLQRVRAYIVKCVCIILEILIKFENSTKCTFLVGTTIQLRFKKPQNRHFGMVLTSPILSFWHHFKSGGAPDGKSQWAGQHEHSISIRWSR